MRNGVRVLTLRRVSAIIMVFALPPLLSFRRSERSQQTRVAFRQNSILLNLFCTRITREVEASNCTFGID